MAHTAKVESKPEEVLWALIDKDGRFCGGHVTHGKCPSAIGHNPEGHREVQVDRFPLSFEHWDDDKEKWATDHTHMASRSRQEFLVDLKRASREEFYQLILEEVDTRVLNILVQLFPECTLSEEEITTLLPLARRTS